MAVAAPAQGVARAQAEEEQAGGLRVVGQMTRPPDPRGRPMVVDGDRALGFVAERNAGTRLRLMDLARLVPGNAVGTRDAGYNPEVDLALDTSRQRLYATAGFPGSPEVVCRDQVPAAPALVAGQRDLVVFDYRVGPDGRRILREGAIAPMPCAGPVQFSALTNSYDATHDLLYYGGVPASEVGRNALSDANPFPWVNGGTLKDDRGQPLLVRQLRITDTRLVLDWEVDLRLAGCGRRDGQRQEGFVGRLGDEVLAYCWDARPHKYVAGTVGPQGYLVRIPLVADPATGVMRPATRDGAAPAIHPVTKEILNYAARRIPTLPGTVTPILDQVSGRVLLVTADATNGNAVWVFDPQAERFVGVITGGYTEEGAGNSAVGFDPAKGRVYVLTHRGILIAPVRVDPLPAGLVYPVLAHQDRGGAGVSSNRISVAADLGRLFVPIGGLYQVVEDRVPDPPAVTPLDPDALTTQIKEEEGHTARASGGQALASGLHLVNPGGGPRLVGQSEPTCSFSPPNVQSVGTPADVPDWELAPALFGACLAELALTPGHREALGAAAELEAGTGSGATARGAALAFASNDSGTDGDLRRPTDCGTSAPDQADRWGRRWPFPDRASIDGAQPDPVLKRDDKYDYEQQFSGHRDAFWGSWKGQRESGQAQYLGACNAFQDGMAGNGGPDLRTGTKGADGKGFPVPAAVCGDFGGQPSAEAWPGPTGGQPQAGYPHAAATCDASGPAAQGLAALGGLALPSAADPQLSVARVSSRVESALTPQGQVTVALASASGVQIGPLAIAEIRSLAVTRAHGHRGTAEASLVRQWCGLRLADQAQQGCVDPDTPQVKKLLDDLNAGALQKVQLSVPQASAAATPGGYQAVVTKHPGQRGGDQTVNDDDSHTVAALQAVVYNDGPKGRSRLVVQLAGVHAESRYGIIELPNFSTGPPGSEPGPGPEPGPEPEPAPAPEPVADVPPAPGPLPDVFTPETFYEDGFGTDASELIRFDAPPPQTVTVRAPRGNPLEQVVRVPVRALSDAINLLVQNPREAALLFAMWALLAGPVYLGLRRRSFLKALVARPL